MKRLNKLFVILNVVIAVIVYFSIDIKDSFDVPQSFVVFDQEQVLLGAKIASDEQWRFPLIDSIPDNYKQALLCFEDKSDL